MKMHYFAPTRGAFYVKNKSGKYVNVVKQAGLSNAMFGYRTLGIDLTGSGYKDILVANIDGPLRVFLNDGKMTEMVPEAELDVENDNLKAPAFDPCSNPHCAVCSKEIVTEVWV